MRRSTSLAILATSLILASLASGLPHGDEDMNMGDMGDSMSHPGHEEPHPSPTAAAQDDTPMSYFAYGEHSGTIVAHVALMIISWCFVLPAGKLVTSNLLPSCLAWNK